VVAVTEGDACADDRAVEGAFDAFYRSEYAAVVRLAFALTGRREVAEELTQEGFLAAHRRWAAVSAYDSPAGWVRRVVTNHCVSAARRRLTEVRLLTRLGQERPDEPPIGAGGAELWALVRELPRRQAQVVALAFLEDRSIRDIASVLGCGEESVRTHLRRGRQALGQRLSEGRGDG